MTSCQPTEQYHLVTEEELLDLLSFADAKDYLWTKQTEENIRNRTKHDTRTQSPATDALDELDARCLNERDRLLKLHFESSGNLGKEYKWYNTFRSMIATIRKQQQKERTPP